MYGISFLLNPETAGLPLKKGWGRQALITLINALSLQSKPVNAPICSTSSFFYGSVIKTSKVIHYLIFPDWIFGVSDSYLIALFRYILRICIISRDLENPQPSKWLRLRYFVTFVVWRWTVKFFALNTLVTFVILTSSLNNSLVLSFESLSAKNNLIFVSWKIIFEYFPYGICHRYHIFFFITRYHHTYFFHSPYQVSLSL